ncbi:HAMP domain-containing sensor histidine kinase [Actinoplanes sp. NBRC 103695]|uniref:sensor histidine kinase n=1 Tax=Actinoplanes sp. NBRC 103695 TaxID=3032202 RepID=UPI002553D976|nr:HAMP domain-containing sensor histidine kinase [Actinoplanes sp. NBRC 103695]
MRVSLRHSLVTRLLATSLLIALGAVAATAWLAVRTTSQAIRQEQGQSLADGSRIYDGLLAYAATHKDWTGVEQTLASLVAGTGRRATLTDLTGRRIAGDAGIPTERPAAVVDPLHDKIDPRIAGPYRLSSTERQASRKIASDRASCLEDYGIAALLTVTPTGRTVVTATGDVDGGYRYLCLTKPEDGPMPTERRALEQLEKAVNECVNRPGGRAVVYLGLDFTYRVKGDAPRVGDCVDAARREQLRPYVAPAARLYLDGPAASVDGGPFDLSGRNLGYVAGATGLVLLLVIVVTVAAGRRLVRPLRELTAAAQRPLDLDSPVPVARDDEIGRLAAAFNDLAARRQAGERQRRAMVSDVAHELRTPLTNMRIWLEAAQDGLAPLDPELLDLLTEEAVLLQHVIDDLRDLAAAEAGDLRLNLSDVYVDDLLRQVVEAHRGAAERGGVRLTLSGTDPRAVLDPVRLRQLVGNLVSNAVRHTPPGGTVTLTSGVVPGALVISVADTGAGIPPEDLPHVFDRFWRADKARSRATGGSGLGLAIARNLAQAHAGDLTATSVAGEGSTFTVRLPH